jgi:type IV fimbrial biogenesis protein FimT
MHRLRGRCLSRRLERGFTLIELLVTLAIMAVLLKVVVPSFGSAFLSNKLASYANAWVASVQVARGEAVKRNFTVTLCRSSDGLTCATTGTWQQGWIVMCPTNDGATCNAVGTTNLVLQKREALSADYHFTTTTPPGAPYSISFPPGGLGSTVYNLILCRAAPTPGNQERTIALSAIGHTTVATTRNGVCS